MGFKDIVCNVVHKIEMNEDRVDVLIDLTYLFQVIDSNGRILVRISEPRQNIAISDNLYDIEYTVDKLDKILKDELNKRTKI